MEISASAGEGQDSPSTMLFCRMCQAVYRQPKILPCLHSFCRPCLVDAVSHRQQEGTVIVCPLCSHQAHLPASGIVGVPDNVFLNRMCQEYVSEVQSHLAAKSFSSPPVGAGSARGGGGDLSKFKHANNNNNNNHHTTATVRRGSQDADRESGSGSESPPAALSIDRGPASGQSTATALEAIRNMSRLQNKILSLQGDALRVTYAIEQVNQSMVDWHQHKEDIKRTIQRRSSQFQFYIKRMEHQLLSQIDSKHPDDEFYGESDQSKTRLREVLKNILHEVSVLKSVQEFGKDAEINTLCGNLLGKSVGMSEVKLKKFHFKVDTPTKSIEDIVAESFGKVNLASDESTVFSPEIVDFTNLPVGGAGEGYEAVACAGQMEKREAPAMDTEMFESAIGRATTTKRSSDRRSRRHNTDLGLDKEDVREYLAQFQTARETFRTRRREILAQGHKREDASPFREEAPKRPQSPLGRGRVQSLDRRAMPVTRKDKSVLPSKPDITQVTTTASRQPDIMPENPPENGKFQYGAGVSHSLPGVIPEDITLPSPVIEEAALPTSPQKVLVKQTSEPRPTYEMSTSSSDEKSPTHDVSPPSHTQSLMEQLRSRRFSNPMVSAQRRYSDQPTAFFPSDHQLTLDLQGQDRVSTRPLRRAISGASDRKSKMEFLRETWQKRKEILMQNEGFIPSETPSPRLDTLPSALKSPPQSPPAVISSSPPLAAPVDNSSLTAEVTTTGPVAATAASPEDPASRMLQIRNRLAHYRNELAGTVSARQEPARNDRLVTTTKDEEQQQPQPLDQPLSSSVRTDSLTSGSTRLATASTAPVPTPVVTAAATRSSLLSSSRTLSSATPFTLQSRLTTTSSTTAAATTTSTATSATATRESRYSRYISKPTEKFDVASLIAAMYSGREKTIIHTQAHTSAPSIPASQNGITTTTTTTTTGGNETTTTSYSRSFLSSRPSVTAATTITTETPPPTDSSPLPSQSAVTDTSITTAPTKPAPYQSEYRRYRYSLASRENSQDSTTPSEPAVSVQSTEVTTVAPESTTTQPITTSQYQSKRSRYGTGSRDGVNRRHTIEIGRDTIRTALRAHAEKYPQVLETIPDSPAMQQEIPAAPAPTYTGASPDPAVDAQTQQPAVAPPVRLLDRLRYGGIKQDPSSYSTATVLTSRLPAPDPESIPDTTISHHITARGVTTKTIPYPLVLEPAEEQRSPLSPRLIKDSPPALVAALASGRPLSPSASPTSPTAGDVAAKGRLRELARKKRERWRHLTIH